MNNNVNNVGANYGPQRNGTVNNSQSSASNGLSVRKCFEEIDKALLAKSEELRFDCRKGAASTKHIPEK